MFKKFKKAFTITELVIVIAVIAILAAVLIPTFSTVIGKANESAAMQECRSEWTNLSAEVMKDETAGKDYLFSIEKDGKTYYFAVIGGNFKADPANVESTDENGALTGEGVTLTITIKEKAYSNVTASKVSQDVYVPESSAVIYLLSGVNA